MSLFFIFIFFISFYLFIRNYWVYKTRKAWNNEIYNYRMNLIDKESNLYKKISYSEMFDSIASYHKMLFSLNWSLDSFVINREIFELIRYDKHLNWKTLNDN